MRCYVERVKDPCELKRGMMRQVVGIGRKIRRGEERERKSDTLMTRHSVRKLLLMLSRGGIPRSTRLLIDYFLNQNQSKFKLKISSSPFKVSYHLPQNIDKS
jgi:hypothetical protein